jgi:hypothetical protein
MATKKQRIWRKLERIWAKNVAATGTRETEANTLQTNLNMSNWYCAGQNRKMRGDVVKS